MSVNLRTTVTRRKYLQYFLNSQRNYSKLHYCLPQSDVCSCVGFIRFLYLVKLKVEAGVLCQLAGSGQFFDERQELMMVPSIIVQLYLPNELDLYPIVFDLPSLPM